MKIEYKFVTGTVEVEVPDEWETVLVDLDRQEYNNDHKETRRHCSLEAYNLDDGLLPSDEDVVRDILAAEERQHLYEAIRRLRSGQRKGKSRRQVFALKLRCSQPLPGKGYVQVVRGQDIKTILRHLDWGGGKHRAVRFTFRGRADDQGGPHPPVL